MNNQPTTVPARDRLGECDICGQVDILRLVELTEPGTDEVEYKRFCTECAEGLTDAIY